MRPPTRPLESFPDMTFPVAGIDVSAAFSRQRRGTTPLGINVRSFEPGSNRSRGGQRAGLSKYIAATPTGGLIQELFTLVGVGYSPPGGIVQTSSSGRVVTLVAVSGGNVYAASPGGTTWSLIPNGTATDPPLLTAGVIHSAANNQKLYFADGANYCYFDPALSRVVPWVATAGALPRDLSGNAPRLICTWRGRTIVSGLMLDPQNWFMSAVSDPSNWDTFPAEPSPAQAITGNDSPLGLIGDVVTSLVPYTDDVLIVGGDHTIWQISGDPMAGGQIDLISDSIGFAWGVPWCKGPDGTLYFVSNRTGIYMFQPGQGAPQRMSQPIEQLLSSIDTGTSTIRLIWDDRFQGLHVFVTKTGSQAAATHFFWEQRAQAWWKDEFANTAHNPMTCCVFDGNTLTDRVSLIGSWDGYVRAIDPTANTDDGTPISSFVVIGPLLSPKLDDMLLKDLQAVLGETSGSVTYEVFVGQTAEQALATAPIASGTWGPGRNLTSPIRRAGHAVYVAITASNPWALEGIRARLTAKGKVRARGT